MPLLYHQAPYLGCGPQHSSNTGLQEANQGCTAGLGPLQWRWFCPWLQLSQLCLSAVCRSAAGKQS